MARVFVSYRHERSDQALACRLTEALEREGHDVFFDRALPPGIDFDAYIREELDAADAFLLLVTRAAHESKWVRAELGVADELGDKRGGRPRIIPLILEDFSSEWRMKWRAILGSLHHIYCVDPARQWNDALRSILQELERLDNPGLPRPRGTQQMPAGLGAERAGAGRRGPAWFRALASGGAVLLVVLGIAVGWMWKEGRLGAPDALSNLMGGAVEESVAALFDADRRQGACAEAWKVHEASAELEPIKSVRLKVRRYGGGETFRFDGEDLELGVTMDRLVALLQGPVKNVMILGRGGSGKTPIAEHILYARFCMEMPALFFELKHVFPSDAPEVQGQEWTPLVSAVEKRLLQDVGAQRVALWTFLKHNPMMLVLDGLDEIPAGAVGILKKELAEIRVRSPLLRVVATGRPPVLKDWKMDYGLGLDHVLEVPAYTVEIARETTRHIIWRKVLGDRSSSRGAPSKDSPETGDPDLKLNHSAAESAFWDSVKRYGLDRTERDDEVGGGSREVYVYLSNYRDIDVMTDVFRERSPSGLHELTTAPGKGVGVSKAGLYEAFVNERIRRDCHNVGELSRYSKGIRYLDHLMDATWEIPAQGPIPDRRDPTFVAGAPGQSEGIDRCLFQTGLFKPVAAEFLKGEFRLRDQTLTDFLIARAINRTLTGETSEDGCMGRVDRIRPILQQNTEILTFLLGMDLGRECLGELVEMAVSMGMQRALLERELRVGLPVGLDRDVCVEKALASLRARGAEPVAAEALAALASALP